MTEPTKIINIMVPLSWEIPEILITLNAEEIAFILKTGCNMIQEARHVVVSLSQKEIYNKIKEESKGEIQKLEIDILVQKELKIQIEENIKTLYENQIEKLENQNKQLILKNVNYEVNNMDAINNTKDKYEYILETKDKTIDRLSTMYETLVNNFQNKNNKSTSDKGIEGEKTFAEYSETFMDFEGYQLVDKHIQAGSGDFHLHFKEFDVLVDVKNYKKKIPNEQKEKIKNDLLKNSHLHFAWLVSLNSSIEKFDKAPIMYEWINTTQCIVYINNLSSFEDPKKILRIVWFTCKELYKMIEGVTEANVLELSALKEKQFKLIDKIKDTRKNIRELNTTINVSRGIIQLMDDQLKEIIENETSQIINSCYSVFDEWFETNIEKVEDPEYIINSTELWTRFKQSNKQNLKDDNLDITVDKFKHYIKTKMSSLSLVVKNKNLNSAFDIKGIKFIYKIEEPIVLNKEPIIKAKNKNIKLKFYFDEERDNKILNDYENYDNNIFSISTNNSIKIFEVVSVLVKHKIINNRNEARGYDKYIETEEYQQKVN
jgi:hypothetical protein